MDFFLLEIILIFILNISDISVARSDIEISKFDPTLIVSPIDFSQFIKEVKALIVSSI